MLTRVKIWLHKRNALLSITRESGGVSGSDKATDVDHEVMPSQSYSTRVLGMREMGIRDGSESRFYARQSSG